MTVWVQYVGHPRQMHQYLHLVHVNPLLLASLHPICTVENLHYWIVTYAIALRGLAFLSYPLNS